MLRTQAVIVKNKKKSTTTTSSNINVNKTKGAKSENGDKSVKCRTNTGEIASAAKSGVKSSMPIKVQGQHYRSDNVMHSLPPPNPSQMVVDFGDRKFERSNSFFLTRKLSKIYDSLTNSKESLKDNDTTSCVKKPAPFKFIRSVSLAAISLKKDYRNSMRKPKLEQLSEEDHPFGVPIEKSKRKNDKKSKTASVDSLTSRTSEKSSVLSSFKRTFSLTPSRRKSSNPKWSASLMSLQQIDIISYEDLSFIDYDKFNTYEENLMNKIKSSNQIDGNRTNVERFPGVKMRQRSTNDTAQRRHSTIYQQTTQTDEDTANWVNTTTNPSKRWSNPCIIPNTAEYTTFPSNVSAVTAVQPMLGAVDCSVSTNCLNEITNDSTTKIARSVDDLTEKSNEKTDFLMLQTVSGSIYTFIYLFNSFTRLFSSRMDFRLWHGISCFDFHFFFFSLSLRMRFFFPPPI